MNTNKLRKMVERPVTAWCKKMAGANNTIPFGFGRVGWLLLAGGCGLIALALLRALPPGGRGPSPQDIPAPGRRHNVLLISIDALRADHLKCYGYPRETSPNIDSVAAEGVIFTNAYTQWPKTGPSFASMMTSTYSDRSGAKRQALQRLDDRNITLAEILRDSGYRTAAFIGNPVLFRLSNFDQGFDHFVECGRHDRVITAEFLQWLDGLSSKEPFFAWVHYLNPHAPYTPEGPEKDLFVGDSLYLRQDAAPLKVKEGHGLGGVLKKHYLGEDKGVRDYVAMYDAEIRGVDRYVGKIIDRMESLGFMDNTFLIITSDHGESMGEHNYYFDHGMFVYDATLKIPLIIRAPHVKHRVVDSLVGAIDFAPTILDYVGIPIMEPMAGVSFLPLLRGGGKPRHPLFAEGGYADDYYRCMIRGPWKLIYSGRDEKGDPIYEMYDLDNDPDEEKNRYQALRYIHGWRMRRKLEKWMELNSKDIAEDMIRPGEIGDFNIDRDLDDTVKDQLRALGYIQ